MLSELKVMRGPNQWSPNHHRLIVIKIDSSFISDKDPLKFFGALKNLFPLIEKFDKPLNNNQLEIARLLAYLGYILQKTAGSAVSYYKEHLLGNNSYYAVFEYEVEEAGTEAAHSAARIAETLLKGESYPSYSKDINELKSLQSAAYPGPSTNSIIVEAINRNITVKKIADGRFVILGQGKYQKKIEGTIGDQTSNIAVDIAGDKETTKRLLEDAFIPVPKGLMFTDETYLDEAITLIGFPLVTKPVNGHQGKCITTNIRNKEELHAGFKIAQAYSRHVIVEKFISGNDFRFLVINYKLIAVAERSPASVTGDGVHTVQELIDNVNADPRRGEGHENVLTKIIIDDDVNRLLADRKLTLKSIPEPGALIILKDTANLSTGGTATDVTDMVHPVNIVLAERVAQIIGLDICGIDIMAPDVSTPLTENGGVILEVNAAPGLRMHLAPSYGKPRPVGKAIIDLMFPNHTEARVPIIAITGTNGKTTTTRLMAYIAQVQGYHVGYTTTEGIYLNGNLIKEGDCTGPKSTSMILHEPMVDFAVLECARGGIIRSGLGVDQVDVGIVTNVAADHLGLEDIDTIEDMARVKAVVPQSVKPGGFAVLNAADDLVYGMAKDLSCNIALFCINASNERITEHCRKDGVACVLDADGNIVIKKGGKEIVIENVLDIPLTMQGKANFMIENVMAAALAAYVLNFSVDTVKAALKVFSIGEEFTPGRLNMLNINAVNVMVDYAHNPHSLKAFAHLIRNFDGEKTGIITGVGDRRDEDIIEVGKVAAEMFDHIIIRIDKDTRGRSGEEIVQLLEQGIESSGRKVPYEVVPEMKAAVLKAVKDAEPGSYVVVNAEEIFETLQTVKEIREELSIVPEK